MAGIEGITRERIEGRVNSGLRGHWYAVCKSVQVQPGGKPYAGKLLGERIVVWRGADGALRCLEDYCPHRGAPLSRGEVLEDGSIACRYHGVVLDGAGVIKQVPAMPSCALEGRRAARAYPAQEVADAVFVYVPSVERPDPPPLVPPAELTSPEWGSFLCVSPWAVNYRYALDNLADPMHGCYLHANSFTLGFGAKQDLMQLDRTDDGFVVKRVQQQGENFDWTEMLIGEGQEWCRLDIPYPPKGGPGGPFRILGCVTPVDERECLVWFWRLRQVGGFARESWRFLYRAALEPRHWHVLEQDREMLEAMPDDARRREMLYQHDVGVARMRQALMRMAKSELAAEDAAAAGEAAKWVPAPQPEAVS